MSNPYANYWNDIGSKNYYGSSGYYAGRSSLTSSPYDFSAPGTGYAGDVSKNSIAARYGLSPQAIGTSPDSWDSGAVGNRANVANDGIAYVGGSTTRFNGKDSSTGKYYVNGLEQTRVPGSDDYINPNDPNQRYQAVSITKNPALNDVVNKETDQLSKSIDASVKNYSDLLPDYNAAGAASVAASKTAADTTGAQNTLQNAQNRFSTGLDNAQTDYAALDAANAAKQRDIVARRYADEATYNDLQDQQNRLAQAGVMRMTDKNGALAGGRPFGTDAQAAFARESYAAGLPYQLAKENYHQGNLANESGVETNLTADEARRIGFNVSAQSQQFQSAQGTAQAIQALKVAGASQDQETVKRILQNPQMLQEAMRQSISGDTQLSLLLTQALGANNYQALQDRLGVNVSQPLYFSQQQPGYGGARTPQTSSPQYFPGNGGGGTQTNGGVQYNPNGKRWEDSSGIAVAQDKNGNWVRVSSYNGGTAAGPGNPYATNPYPGNSSQDVRYNYDGYPEGFYPDANPITGPDYG